MDKQTFKKEINKLFKITLPENKEIALELKSVDDLKSNHPEQKREPFSLIFIGPSEHHLIDNTYEMYNETMGNISVFISAFQKDENGIYYDSVFN